MENVVVNSFGEGWWRRGGVEVANSGCSAARRPVVDPLSNGRQTCRGRSEGKSGERKGEGKSEVFWG